MAETAGTQEKDAAAQSGASAKQVPFNYSPGRPIVLEYKAKKKKKNRYSGGLGDIQRAEGQMAKIMTRASKSVSKGSTTYEKSRRKSARSKKDGAIKDFIPNMGEAWSESISQASGIPADIADAMNTKSTRRLLRNQLRMVSGGLRIWRI